MTLDSGVITIYRQTLVSSPGEIPKYDNVELWSSYFGNKTIGLTRYYTAKSHNDNIDLFVEVQRNDAISAATDKAKIGNCWYRIVQVQHILDDDGLPMTDLTLERVSGIEQN